MAALSNGLKEYAAKYGMEEPRPAAAGKVLGTFDVDVVMIFL